MPRIGHRYRARCSWISCHPALRQDARLPPRAAARCGHGGTSSIIVARRGRAPPAGALRTSGAALAPIWARGNTTVPAPPRLTDRQLRVRSQRCSRASADQSPAVRVPLRCRITMQTVEHGEHPDLPRVVCFWSLRLSAAGVGGSCEAAATVRGQAERALPGSSSWCFSPVQIRRSMRPPRAPTSGPSIRIQPLGRTCQSQLMTVLSPSAAKVSLPVVSIIELAVRELSRCGRSNSVSSTSISPPALPMRARNRVPSPIGSGVSTDAGHGRVE